MIELTRIRATLNLRYRTLKLRATMWLFQRVMECAERPSRPAGENMRNKKSPA
jgi:hypothetical protein